jgi:hypothetical protein
MDMPNEKKLPSDYDDYVRLAKRSTNTSAITLLNKFCFRYRLAEDFEGLKAPNVGRTLAGYDVITKIFLAYTAYEIIVKAARLVKIHSVQRHELNTIFDTQLAKKIRKNDKLKSFLINYPHEYGLSNKIKLFFNESTSDVVCVAYALRNIFAHGELTASAIGTDTIAKRKVFDELANKILDYCDDTFTICLTRL